ncbi:MAG TPA: MCP four helix bundle domain-containing protein, partial [Armatimonadota bacterium]|nr:MCP four helix bundle domain-containing protein [Armatimonadota bacterium]
MFQTMKLGMKILLSLCAIIAIAIIVGLIGLRGLSRTSKSLDTIATNLMPSIDNLRIISENQETVLSCERAIVNPSIFANAEIRNKQFKAIDAAFSAIDSAWKIYDNLPRGTEEDQLWQELTPQWDSWKAKHKTVRDLTEEKARMMDAGTAVNDPKILALDKQILAASLATREDYLTAEATLEKLQKINEDGAIAERKQALSVESSARNSLITMILLGVIGALALGGWFFKHTNGIVNALLGETQHIIDSTINGQLGVRGRVEKINAEFRPIIQGFNNALDAVIGPLHEAADYMARIAQGDIPSKSTKQSHGEFEILQQNVNQCINAINAMLDDAKTMTQAALAGQLTVRADIAKHQGEFRAIIQGVNDTMDAVVGPLHAAAARIDRIAKGDIPPKDTTNYNGEFNSLNDSLNQCTDAINALIADAKYLVQAADAGKLDARADVSQHQGDFQLIIQGLNDTMEAMVTPLNEAQDVLGCLAINDLTKKMDGQYNGDFATFATAINDVRERLASIREYFIDISHGDVSRLEELQKVGKRCAVDEIMPAIITSMQALSMVITGIGRITSAAQNGDLTQRANPDLAKGAFREIALGINSLSDSYEQTVIELNDVVAQVAESAEQMATVAENIGKASQEVA